MSGNSNAILPQPQNDPQHQKKAKNGQYRTEVKWPWDVFKIHAMRSAGFEEYPAVHPKGGILPNLNSVYLRDPIGMNQIGKYQQLRLHL